jgi:xanthine/CO dehydrogenase XdhC/CoxF family maturation factor
MAECILGPKKRTESLLGELGEEGLSFTREQLERLHGPAGLDIGAESPEQIALALVAEIQAVLAGRSGGWLCVRQGPIHDQGA